VKYVPENAHSIPSFCISTSRLSPVANHCSALVVAGIFNSGICCASGGFEIESLIFLAIYTSWKIEIAKLQIAFCSRQPLKLRSEVR